MTHAVPPSRGEQGPTAAEQPPPFWSHDEYAAGILTVLAVWAGLLLALPLFESAPVAVAITVDKGVITVRVSAVEPGRRLVAEVIEQTIERRALLLSTVTVTCEPIGPQRTRVMLRLDFVPCMGPRWYWRPFEHWFGGIAFDAVFDAWEREVCEPVATPGG